MRSVDSLRFRILMSFTTVGLVLSILFGWFAVGMMHLVEDHYGQKRLENFRRPGRGGTGRH